MIEIISPNRQRSIEAQYLIPSLSNAIHSLCRVFLPPHPHPHPHPNPKPQPQPHLHPTHLLITTDPISSSFTLHHNGDGLDISSLLPPPLQSIAQLSRTLSLSTIRAINPESKHTVDFVNSQLVSTTVSKTSRGLRHGRTGTSIFVSHLFYNLPVREASATHSESELKATIMDLCLSNTEVNFTLVHSPTNKVIFQTTPLPSSPPTTSFSECTVASRTSTASIPFLQ